MLFSLSVATASEAPKEPLAPPLPGGAPARAPLPPTPTRAVVPPPTPVNLSSGEGFDALALIFSYFANMAGDKGGPIEYVIQSDDDQDEEARRAAMFGPLNPIPPAVPSGGFDPVPPTDGSADLERPVDRIEIG